MDGGGGRVHFQEYSQMYVKAHSILTVQRIKDAVFSHQFYWKVRVREKMRTKLNKKKKRKRNLAYSLVTFDGIRMCSIAK